MKKLFLSLIVLVSLSMPACADEHDKEYKGTILNLSATEKMEVEQDLLVASLRIQIERKEAKQVQDEINKAMQKAVAGLKKYDSVKVQTGQYRVYPDYRYEKKDGKNERVLEQWRGTQTIMLKGKKANDVLNATGMLQDADFVMNSLNYQLSPEKYDEIRDGLMETTIVALTERANRVAKALGKDDVDFTEINVDARQAYQPPVMYRGAPAMMEMAGASDAKMAAPVAEAGETTVSMTISAQALIKD